MNLDSEFREIGKRMPYKVPDGFFENITEKTLEEARRREKTRKKYIVIWRSMAAAASLTALIVAGYLLFNLPPQMNTRQTARDVISEFQNADTNKEAIKEMKSLPSDKETGDNESELIAGNGSADEEGINDFLTSLTNDELIELAAMYESDIFIEDTENNLQ